MDLDNELLIHLVFKKSALWDRKNKLHSNRIVINDYWKEISLEMKQDENKLRKRWRYLRDQFAVELGKIPPSRLREAGNTYCTKWPYFKSLLFLKDIVKARPITSKLKRRRSSSAHAEHNEEDNQSTSDNDSSVLPSPRYTEEGEDSVQPDHIGIVQEDNEHLLFFKSLLSHVNKIPQHMLLSLRNRVQSVVEEFAYGSLPNYYNDPSSSNDVKFL